MTTPAGHPAWLLSANSLAATTTKKYSLAVLNFTKWAATHGIKIYDKDYLDRVASHYAVDKFMENGGVGKQSIADLKSGLIWLDPGLENHLPRLSRAHKGWQRAKPVEPWQPIPREAATAIAARLASKGKYDMAVAVLLSYSALLRVGELLRLRRGDVTLASDARVTERKARPAAALALRKTKTGDNLTANVHHQQVAELLESYMSETKGRDTAPLFNFKEGSYRNNFKAAARELGLGDLQLHGLRHGCATDLVDDGMSINDVLKAGRCAVTKSAIHYVQQGRALQAAKRLPAKILAAGARLWANLHKALQRAQR
jgi:integrase